MERFLLQWLFLLLIAVSMVSSKVDNMKTEELVLKETQQLNAKEEFEEELLKQIKQGKYGPGSLRSYQCPGECIRRCGRTQYHKPCMFFCQKCCSKCLCVPPGYYGNKQSCPCYNNWKTKRGGPKCP